MTLRKQYLLISSDDRSAFSRSTTDFTVKLREPIDNVVKTDLVSIAMDYNLANIKAPNNTLVYQLASNGTPFQTATIEIPEDQYTASELATELYSAMDVGIGVWDVKLVNRHLVVEVLMTSALPTVVGRITVTSTSLQQTLGMTSADVNGTFISSLGAHGGLRFRFPREVRMPSTSPYILIQSRALGVKAKTVSGQGFYRALINDSENNKLVLENNRTNEYVDEPKRLDEIDINLAFSNGQSVDNRGSAFSFLLEIVTSK